MEFYDRVPFTGTRVLAGTGGDELRVRKARV